MTSKKNHGGAAQNLIESFSYAVMENLRYMLYQYRSKTSLYFGHRFTEGAKGKGHFEGFMAG
jgi:hypothetical protein